MRKRTWYTMGIAALLGVVMGFAPVQAKAGMVSFSDSVPLMSTNWADNVTVPKFNDGLAGVPTGAVLTQVKITLDGDVTGQASYESTDAAPGNVSLNLQATIELTRPDLTQIVMVLPVVNVVDPASAFDGTIDFAGTSGGTFPGLAGGASEMAVLTNLADLALFTGLGNIVLPANAVGSSQATGLGNVISQFATNAGADVTVEYTFRTNDVPEPASMTLMALGCMALLRRPRR